MNMATTRWLNDEEMRLWRAFLVVAMGVPAQLDAQLKEVSTLSLDDYEVLVHLSEADEQRVRMSELSAKLLHSRSRLTQRVDRLATRGLVRREKCTDDGRGTWAVLTDDGYTALRSAAPQHVEDVRANLFDHLHDDDVAALMPVMERIAQAIETTRP